MLNDEIKNLMAKLRKQNNNSLFSNSTTPRFTNSFTNVNSASSSFNQGAGSSSAASQLHIQKQKTQKELDSDDELEREILEFDKNIMGDISTGFNSIQTSNNRPEITASKPSTISNISVSTSKIIPKPTTLNHSVISNQQKPKPQQDDDDLDKLEKELLELDAGLELDTSPKTTTPSPKTDAIHITNKASKSVIEEQSISLNQQKPKPQQDDVDLDKLEKELLELDSELELNNSPKTTRPITKPNTIQTTNTAGKPTIEKPPIKLTLNKSKPQKQVYSDEDDEDALYRELMESEENKSKKSPKKANSASTSNIVGKSYYNALTLMGKEVPKSSINTNMHVISKQQKLHKFSNVPIQNNKPEPSTSNSKRPTSILELEEDLSILESKRNGISKGSSSIDQPVETPQSSNSSTSSLRAKFSNSNDTTINKKNPSSGLSGNNSRIHSTTSTQSKRIEFRSQVPPIYRQLSEDDAAQDLTNAGPPGPAGFYARYGQSLRYTDLTHTQVDKRPGEGEEGGGFTKKLKLMELERAQLEERHLLRKSGWANFINHYEQREYKELGLIIQSNSIDKIYKNEYKGFRVPYLALVIKTVEYSDSDGGIEFFDPTNRIHSSVSQSLIEEYEPYCKPGIVWVLERPTLYKPKKGDYHLVIHYSNLVQVFLTGKKVDGSRQEPIAIRDFKPFNSDDQASTQNQSTFLYDISEAELISANETGEGQQTDKWNEFLDDEFDEFGDVF